ncbi:MAG TPA: hypothetical protein VN848_12980 [Gemmatimonadales bacterium]|nr:hypothetical protein [Gemmatimonadales bacterium]
MPPLLALGLLAVAGLLATRLRVVLPELGPRRDLVIGLATLGCGLVLGPGIGVLDRSTLDRLAPLGMLAAAWMGAGVGTTFDQRLVRSVRDAARKSVAIAIVVTIGVSTVGALLLARFVPALGALWVPRLEAVGVLGCVAALSDPRLAVAGGSLSQAASHRFAQLETAAGVLVLTCFTIVVHPHPAGGGGWREILLIVAAAASLWLFGSLRRMPKLAPSFALALALLAGAALGSASGISPFVSGALGAMVWTRMGSTRALRSALGRWERPMALVLALLCGAELGGPTPWLLGGAALLAALRIGARWGALALARPGTHWPPETALSTLAQGRAALGAGLGCALALRGTATGTGSGVLATVVLAVALGQGVVALSALFHGRPLTRSPVAPELNPDPTAD